MLTADLTPEKPVDLLWMVKSFKFVTQMYFDIVLVNVSNLSEFIELRSELKDNIVILFRGKNEPSKLPSRKVLGHKVSGH